MEQRKPGRNLPGFLMWEPLPQKPIHKRSQDGEGYDHQDRQVPGTYQGKHGPGAGTGQCPAQAKDDPPVHIAAETPFLGLENDGFPVHGLDFFPFYELYHKNAHYQGRTNDTVHMKGIKPEHFINAEPGSGF